MDRRRLLISGAALALDGCLGGPAPTPVPAPVPPVPRRVVLHPVQSRADRILRTTVGLRPHRTSGFRVEAERLGKHTVVHHYGHGGGGMSTTWGTAWLAAELALAHPDRTAAVLGAGVAGLTTARQLQRRGFAVTLYAAALPPYTTSNASLAHWTPASNLVSGAMTPGFEEQFRIAAEVAYRELQVLVGRDYGVDWMDAWTASDREPGEGPTPGSPIRWRPSASSRTVRASTRFRPASPGRSGPSGSSPRSTSTRSCGTFGSPEAGSWSARSRRSRRCSRCPSG